jgi:hypothetical protein
MKLSLVVAQLSLTALLHTAAGDRADSVLDITEIDRPLYDEEGLNAGSPVVGVDTPPPPTPTPLTPEDIVWRDIRCRGKDLIKAMNLNEADCRRFLGWRYIQSPWDGTLEPEFAKWGYSETSEFGKSQCEMDFQSVALMASAFYALGISKCDIWIPT